METKFRSLPLTILDFLGVLIPGFLWLMLVAETWDALTKGVVGIAGLPEEFQKLSRLAMVGGSWLGPIAIFFTALTVGYSIKPVAMRISNSLAMPLFLLARERHGFRWRHMSFPYREYFKDTPVYVKTRQVLEDVTRLNPEKFPRAATFSAAKRYVHALAPILWEESERLEAEVRMLGALFLAAAYSALLHGLLSLAGLRQGPAWALFSLLAACLLALGFDITRLREVAYTYINVVLVAGMQDKGILAAATSQPPASGQGDD